MNSYGRPGRGREATYLQWTDIDFNRGIVRFRNKPAIKFRIKTAEERDLPLSPRLLASLTITMRNIPIIASSLAPAGTRSLERTRCATLSATCGG